MCAVLGYRWCVVFPFKYFQSDVNYDSSIYAVLVVLFTPRELPRREMGGVQNGGRRLGIGCVVLCVCVCVCVQTKSKLR